MRRFACLLAVLAGCGSDKVPPPTGAGVPAPRVEAPTPTETETPRPSPSGPEVRGQIEVFAPGSPHHHTKIGFAIAAPAGTTATEDGFSLPDGPTVYVVPTEVYIDPAYTYPNHERPRSERAFVSADCATRRDGMSLAPWKGRVALEEPPAGFTLCEGAGFEAAQTSCFYADGHAAAARADCGSGGACLTRDKAMAVLAACETLRRTDG